MNIPELTHGENIINAIPHWPVYCINDLAQTWYFFSSRNCTLRKKLANTSIAHFLKPNNQGENANCQQNDYETKIVNKNEYFFLIVKQIDRRPPRDPQLYPISVKKQTLEQINMARTDELIIRNNEWKAHNFQQINIYKIDGSVKNELYSFDWSSNIVNCNAPISSSLKDKMTEYCRQISEISSRKILNNAGRIKRFQLIFTYDKIRGKIKIVLAHNFMYGSQLGTNQCMYGTNLKIGKDNYERVQLLAAEDDEPKGKDSNDIQCKDELKRMKYIKAIQKLNCKNNELKQKIAQVHKSQENNIINREVQCSACFDLVILEQFDNEKLVSSNRIPQIQILRQVKMKKNHSNNYQMVPVCQLCYSKFKQIVARRNSYAIKQNSNQESNRQEKVTSLLQKQILCIVTNPIEQHPQPEAKPINKREKVVSNYTTNTNTTVQLGAYASRKKTSSINAPHYYTLRDRTYGLQNEKRKKYVSIQDISAKETIFQPAVRNQFKQIIKSRRVRAYSAHRPKLSQAKMKKSYEEKQLNSQSNGCGSQRWKNNERETTDDLTIALMQYEQNKMSSIKQGKSSKARWRKNRFSYLI